MPGVDKQTKKKKTNVTLYSMFPCKVVFNPKDYGVISLEVKRGNDAGS